MRLLVAVTPLVIACPSSLVAQNRAADSVAVLRVIDLHEQAMRNFQADEQAAIYSPDAVWINAFGRRRAGRDSIVAFLRPLYADSGYRASRLLPGAPPEVIFVRPDVAVVHEFHERDGQRMADGSIIARRVHTSFVLSKESGRWLIKYQHIADERPRSQ
jgi:uncharacterized protein (TIGR02246 family)